MGGRLTDLEFLARRLKTGQTPTRAIAEMIEQSANEIMKMYLLTLDKGMCIFAFPDVLTTQS